MGGYLAALYAARHPEVDKVVLMAPAFCFRRRWRETLGDAKMEEWRGSGALDVFHYGEGRADAGGLPVDRGCRSSTKTIRMPRSPC